VLQRHAQHGRRGDVENLADGQKLAYAGRPASASPAVGYYDKHYAQQKALIDTAFSKLKGFVLTK
jgi:2-oxoglutarate dehydrogenase E1 component